LSDYVTGAEEEGSEVEGVGSAIEDFQPLDTLLKSRLNYFFYPFICQVISVWSSNFFLSQFGPHFLKSDSIWLLSLILIKRC